MIVSFQDAAEAAKKADKRKRRVCSWQEIRVCTAREYGRVEACYGASLGGLLETGLVMRATSELCGFDRNTHLHAVGDGAP